MGTFFVASLAFSVRLANVGEMFRWTTCTASICTLLFSGKLYQCFVNV